MNVNHRNLDIETAREVSVSVGSAALGMTKWLSLAAAPTFAIMALLTAVIEGGGGMLCAGQGAWPLGGMVPMYLLMSAFHLAPWLKLISRRRDVPGRNVTVVTHCDRL